MRTRFSCLVGAFALCAFLPGANAAWAGETVLQSPAEVMAMLHARVTCSNHFISGIDPQRTAAEDLRGFGTSDTVIDPKGRRVTSRMHGSAGTAVFVEGAGCTPVIGVSEDVLQAQRAAFADKLRDLSYADTPLVTAFDEKGVDYKLLDLAIASAFREAEDGSQKSTRAIVVMHDGKIIAERYADGVTRDTSLAGFSLSKSVLNAVIGNLVKRTVVGGVEQPVALDEWSAAGDPRSRITYDELMRMTAGLVWSEDYTDPMSDVIVSLMGAYDSSLLAMSRPIYMGSNLYYNYSSGNAQILSVAIRRALQKAAFDPDLFAYQAIFAPIGMKTALIEMDPAGNPGYAASMYASAGDWVRFGQFLLDGGRVGEQDLLPENWIEYSTTPSQLSDSQQGALFAVNRGEYPLWPSLPVDTYAALGFRGQRLLMVPSKSLVILRLGASVPENAWNVEEFAANVIQAVGRTEADAAK